MIVTMFGHVVAAAGQVLVLLIMADDGVLTQVVGSTSSRSSSRRTLVDDDRWHTLYLRRQADVLQLTVDDREAAPVTGQFQAK